MKRRCTLIGLCAVAMLALVVRAGEFPDNWTWDDDAKSRSAHAELEGKPMPALSVSDWMNGQVKPEDMKDKVVVVDFYATWCGPCMAAIPHNNELLKKYKDKGIEYPTAKDPKLESQKAWHVQYYPTYAIVDRKGVVRVVGLQPDYVEQVVQKLLEEK